MSKILLTAAIVVNFSFFSYMNYVIYKRYDHEMTTSIVYNTHPEIIQEEEITELSWEYDVNCPLYNLNRTDR